jgi:hypothetical protein
VDETTRLAGIYLRDHHAGAVGALELLARARRSNDGTELGAFLAELEREVAEDRSVLVDLMGALEVQPSRLKNGLAVAAERLGRLKLNGRIVRRSPLSTLVELEVLETGIFGKRSLWTSLAALEHPRLAGVDFDALARRAEEQIAAVEPWKRRAAAALRGA